MKTNLTCILSVFASIVFSQASIKVEVSADTIQPGELVQVVYSFENGEGQFKAPDLSNLPLVSGPNVSSSFMISNGKKTSSQSYTYIFKPGEEGKIVVPEASYVEDGNTQTIESVTITVNSKLSQLPSKGITKQSQSLKSVREKKKI